MVIWILGFIGTQLGGFGTKIEGDTAKIHHEAAEYLSAKMEGDNVARVIWKAAKRHPRIKRIEVTVEFKGVIVDSYGKKVEGPHIMGTIVVSDLDEIRKYESEDMYWLNSHLSYGIQIRNMKYGNLFTTPSFN